MMRPLLVFLTDMKIPSFAPALVFSLSTASLPAAITYVDATLANTNNAAGGTDSTWADGNDGTTGGTMADGSANNDGLWRYRGGFGGNGLWEATGSASQAENAVEIVTTASGLANGTYNAYVFFVAVEGPSITSGGDEEFPIRAGSVSNPSANQIYTQVVSPDTLGATIGIDASTLSFANTFTPGTATDGRTNYAGLLLGTVEVTDGTLSVYVDDLHAINDADERTWYTGIGYEIVPEPSTFLLGVLGTLTLLVRRRR